MELRRRPSPARPGARRSSGQSCGLARLLGAGQGPPGSPWPPTRASSWSGRAEAGSDGSSRRRAAWSRAAARGRGGGGLLAPWRRPLLRWLARSVELYMPLREPPSTTGCWSSTDPAGSARARPQAGGERRPGVAGGGLLPRAAGARDGVRSGAASRRWAGGCGAAASWRASARSGAHLLRSDGVPLPKSEASPQGDWPLRGWRPPPAGDRTVRLLEQPDPRRSGREVLVMPSPTPAGPTLPAARGVMEVVGDVPRRGGARELGCRRCSVPTRTRSWLRALVTVDGTAVR